LKVFLLFSGGIDSTSLIRYYLDSNFEVKLIWIDYDQKPAKMENKAIDRISEYYKIDLLKINTGIKKPRIDNFEYLGRNLMLFSVALMNFPFKNGLISAGIRLNPRYLDCCEIFTKQIRNMIEFLSRGEISVDFPLIKSSKLLTLRYSLKNQVPLEYTYSCDVGTNPSCNVCPSCIEVQNAYRELSSHE